MPRSPGRGKKLPGGGGKTAAVPEPGSVEPLGNSAASSPDSPAAVPTPSPTPSPPPAPSFDDLPPVAASVEVTEDREPAGRVKADADIVCRAAQLATGLVLDPDEARPTKGDHENMAEATASLLRAKGWQLPATLAAILLFGIYVLSVLNKPKSRAKFKDWLGRQKNPGGSPGVELPVENGAARTTAPASIGPAGKTIPPLAPTPYSSP